MQTAMRVSDTRRKVSLGMIAALVVLLLLSLVIQVWALPTYVWRWVSEYPLLEPLAVPGIWWEIFAIVCWQAVGLIGIRIIVLVRDRQYRASFGGWLWAMVGFLIAYSVLSVGAFIGVKSTGFWSPTLGFALVAVAMFSLPCAAYIVLFFIIRRSLRATAL